MFPVEPASTVFNDADFIDNDEAEVGIVEELRCVSAQEAVDAKQLDDDWRKMSDRPSTMSTRTSSSERTPSATSRLSASSSTRRLPLSRHDRRRTHKPQ
jgi:hypothetical protein